MRLRPLNLLPLASLVLSLGFFGLWLRSYSHGLMLSYSPSRAMNYAIATSGRLEVSWGTTDDEEARGVSLDWWDNGDIPQDGGPFGVASERTAKHHRVSFWFPLWVPVILTAIPPALWTRRWFQRRKAGVRGFEVEMTT